MIKIDYNFQEALLSYLTIKKLSKKTIDKYRMFYNKLTKDTNQLNQAAIDKFLSENQSNPARSMLKNLLKALLRWEIPQETKVEISLLDIPQITGKREHSSPKYIKKEDIEKLTNEINLWVPRDSERIKLMILTQFYAGLRVNELVSISYNSLNKQEYELNKDKQFQTLSISSDSAKFGKERKAYIPTILYKRILLWLKEQISNSKKVFELDKPMWGINKNRYCELLRDESKKILGKSYNSHSLRHGRGTDLIKGEHKPIEFVKKYLGHSDIKSTQIYVHLEDKDIKDELEK